jgi:hypothetical protein
VKEAKAKSLGSVPEQRTRVPYVVLVNHNSTKVVTKKICELKVFAFYLCNDFIGFIPRPECQMFIHSLFLSTRNVVSRCIMRVLSVPIFLVTALHVVED